MRAGLHLIALTGALLAGTASAHGLDAGRMTVELNEVAVMVVATPDTALFPFADDDGDGRLTRAEVKAHRPAIREAFDAALHLTDDSGVRPTCERTDVSTPVDRPDESADHLRVTARCRFGTAPTALKLVYAFADDQSVIVEAVRLRSPPPVAGRPALPERVGPAERAVLGVGDATLRLLATGRQGPTAANENASVQPPEAPLPALGGHGFSGHGAEHVLFGLNYLPFIVAVVLATWWRWGSRVPSPASPSRAQSRERS